MSERLDDRTFSENIQTASVWRTNIKMLTTGSIEWGKLPKTIDPYFIEHTLFHHPAVITFNTEDGPVVAAGFGSSKNNLYRIPINRVVNAPNGFTANLTNDNSYICYNNTDRKPGCYTAYPYAERIARYDSIIDINVNAQKTPVIFFTDEDGEQSMIAAMNEYDANKAYIVRVKGFEDDKIKALSTGAVFIGKDLKALQRDLISEYCVSIGLAGATEQKAERISPAQVYASNSGASCWANERLAYRQGLCDWLWENCREYCVEGKPEVHIRGDALNMLAAQLNIQKPFDVTSETTGREIYE